MGATVAVGRVGPPDSHNKAFVRVAGLHVWWLRRQLTWTAVDLWLHHGRLRWALALCHHGSIA